MNGTLNGRCELPLSAVASGTAGTVVGDRRKKTGINRTWQSATLASQGQPGWSAPGIIVFRSAARMRAGGIHGGRCGRRGRKQLTGPDIWSGDLSCKPSRPHLVATEQHRAWLSAEK